MSNVMYLATDGAFQKVNPLPGYGFCISTSLSESDVIKTGFGLDHRFKESRQIGGECSAVIHGLNTICDLVQQGEICEGTEITVIYDYNGVAKWASGEWAARKPVSIMYKQEINEVLEKLSNHNITVNFSWTPGHEGHELNELADDLAVKAVRTLR